MCVSNCIQQNFLNINISRSHVPQNPSLIQILLIFRRMHDDHIEMIELNGFSSWKRLHVHIENLRKLFADELKVSI
jgi:hypothetical protein